MAKKIIGIALIIIGLFTAFLGFKAMSQAPEAAEKLKEAVYVADAKVYPENEGKVVIVPGKIEAELPLVDVKTGLKLPTIKAIKQSWYAVGVKSVDTGYDWSWIADGAIQTLTAECSVGEFKLYENMLNGLTVSEDYKDFEMLVDWRILSPRGDSGLYLRGAPQVQIWDAHNQWHIGSGGLYNNKKNPSKALEIADNQVGTWNTFRVKMVGEKVSVWLNGKLVVENTTLENYWDRKRPIFPVEQIELQCHGDPVEFRNIFIKEL